MDVACVYELDGGDLSAPALAITVGCYLLLLTIKYFFQVLLGLFPPLMVLQIFPVALESVSIWILL